MKKQIAALTLAALMLSGCGHSPAAEPAEETAASTEILTQAPIKVLTEAPTEVPTTAPADVPTTAPAEPMFRHPGTLWLIDGMTYAYSYHVITEYWRDIDTNVNDVYCVFTCLDLSGNVLWSHESPRGSAGAQVQPIWPLGFSNDMFLYYVQGRVIALDVCTGKTMWESRDTGVCLVDPQAAWVDSDFICLGEYFGSNLAVLDPEGNLIREIPQLDPNLYWISRITRSGSNLIVHLDSGNYESLDGTDITVPIDWIP